MKGMSVEDMEAEYKANAEMLNNPNAGVSVADAPPEHRSEPPPNQFFNPQDAFRSMPSKTGRFDPTPLPGSEANLQLNMKRVNPGVKKEIDNLSASERSYVWDKIGKVPFAEWKRKSAVSRQEFMRNLVFEAKRGFKPMRERMLR